VEQAELSEIAVDREVFQVGLWMLPPQPSLEQIGHENESSFTLVYSMVFKIA